jgi:hypothetical protein
MHKLDYLSNDLKENILEAMASGECSTINELMEQFSLTRYQALQVFDDTQFMTCVAKQSKAEAKMFLHSKGFRRLKDIAQGSDDKAAMSAIKQLAEYTGEISKKSNVDVNISLEQMVRQEEAKNVSPVMDVEFRKIECSPIPRLTRPEDHFDIAEIADSNHLNFEDDFEFVN